MKTVPIRLRIMRFYSHIYEYVLDTSLFDPFINTQLQGKNMK